MVIENEVSVGDPSRVKQVVFRHFRKLYSEVWRGRPILEGPFVTIGNEETVEELVPEFSEEEVRAVVKDSDGNKAPGQMGLI